jgi:2-polyprenyl-6-methoxyphenol hydroxylase-like FAD-dependent oxidoreductase
MTADVVIAGAGPNGLFLACELRRAGVEPLVLERLPEPSRRPKANGLVGRVVEMLDYRGLYERLSGGRPATGPAPGYQFGGFPLELRSLGDHPLRTLPIPQPVLEARLAEYATELGIEIRRGHALRSFAQDEDGVTIEVGSERMRARYLVGADGGQSLVRKQAGIDFPGTTDERFVSRSGRVVIPDSVFLPGTGQLEVPGEPPLSPFQWNRTPWGAFVFASFEPGVFVVSAAEWDQPAAHESVPVTLDELRAAVARVLGRELPIERPDGPGPFGWTRRTGTNSRQADRYREGRVLLLGDAAHVHPAIGGPGLNLGLQDALNLGWKLAAEVHGWAPPGLLDTYQSERHPVGRRVPLHTRAQMTLLSPGEDVTAVREIFGELLDEGIVRRRIAELLAGADVRYDLPGAPHPLLGRWMPDLPLRTERATRVAELMRAGRPVLLDFGGNLGAAAEPWRDRVDHVQANAARPPAEAVLIRPDGYVAWAGGEGLQDALTTWFGSPATSLPRALHSQG